MSSEKGYTDGQCLTCRFNLGPSLPGGTSDARDGCMCSCEAHIRKVFEDDLQLKDALEILKEDGGVSLYRIEIVSNSKCDEWEQGEGVFEKYWGASGEKMRFWDAYVNVFTMAKTKEEAEEKLKEGILVVDDVLDVRETNFNWLKGKTRERIMKDTARAIKRREQRQ